MSTRVAPLRSTAQRDDHRRRTARDAPDPAGDRTCASRSFHENLSTDP